MRFNGLNLSLLSLSILGATSLSGCGGGNNDSQAFAQNVDATKKEITLIKLADNDGYVHTKGTLQLKLLGLKNADDTAPANISAQAKWQLSASCGDNSNESCGKINSSGLFTSSGKAGDMKVTASYAGLQVEEKIIVTNANLSSIEISNSNTSVDVCKDTQFSAKAYFDGGLTLDYPLTWGFKDTASASLASFKDASKPLMSSKKSGQVQVRATGINNAEAVIESNLITFDIANSIQSLTVTSSKSLSMRNGETATLKVMGNYGEPAATDITGNVSFSSSNTSALTVDSAKGTITAKTGSIAGTPVTLTADCNGTTSELQLKILTPEIKSIAIIGPNSDAATEELSISKNGSLSMRTKLTYADTGATTAIYSGDDLEWSIDKTNSDSFTDGDISIVAATGVLSVKDITLSLKLKLTIDVRLKDTSGKTLLSSDGSELKDTIIVYVNP